MTLAEIVGLCAHYHCGLMSDQHKYEKLTEVGMKYQVQVDGKY
jgi:hypothetical protein